jgi:hypothetical protein
MTGSTPSDAYHIPTVLAGSTGGWSRVWIPVVTAAIVVALGFLMIAVTTDRDSTDMTSPPSAVEAASR